ncbi:MAG: ATP-binding cassette domain-containing protein [Candidatus Altiarchaeia archaeon]
MNAIVTANLTKKYDNLVAVDNLNLKVEKGKIFGLLGPNGAGKSTLLSMLCTIINPTAGSARVNGFDITKESSKVRQSIGIVFQGMSVDDKLTGRENLRFHAMLYNVPASVIESRIDDVLRLVELDDRADSILKTYSGGMIRRLEIARGLLHHPAVLFLDEPTIGLDPQTREHIWDYIRDLAKEEKLTIILTTHYMDEADQLCDEIAIIDRGVIKIRDTPENLKDFLSGDNVDIRTKLPDILASGLVGSDFIIEVNVKPDTLLLKVRDGSKNAPHIIDIERDLSVPVDSIRINEPTLNDVFLHYTGKEIRGDQGDDYASKYKHRRMGR